MEILRSTFLLTAIGSGAFAQVGAASLSGVNVVADFRGADAAAKINACLKALPRAGGICDARGLTGSQAMSTDMFAGVTQDSGHILFGVANFRVSATQNLRSNFTLTGVQGSRPLDRSSLANQGTIFEWTGSPRHSMFRIYNARDVIMSGFSLVAGGIAGMVGIEYNGTNAVAGQHIDVGHFSVFDAETAVQWGCTSAFAPGKCQQQLDTSEFHHFFISNYTATATNRAFLINSGNSGQISSIRDGIISTLHGGGVDCVTCADITLERLSGSSGQTFIHQGMTSGLLIEQCQTENAWNAKTNPHAFFLTADNVASGPLTIRSTYINDPVRITSAIQVVSIGNQGQVPAGQLQAVNGTQIVSISDAFPNTTWGASNGQVLNLGPGFPWVIDAKMSNLGIQTWRARSTDPSIRFQNTSSTPSDWFMDFAGTGGLSPGDLFFFDARHGNRGVLTLSQKLGAIGAGGVVNPYARYGEVSSASGVASGQYWFGYSAQTSLAFASGQFTFKGGPVNVPGLKHVTGTQPVCDSAHRGETWYVAGAEGVKDTFNLCAKDKANSFSWRTIY